MTIHFSERARDRFAGDDRFSTGLQEIDRLHRPGSKPGPA